MLVLLGSVSAFAAPVPPAPPVRQGVGIPPPPGDPPLPIDENLVFLLIAALSFGIYRIYEYRLKQKTPA
ncbi:hypothetical protein OIU80_07375 [Flavobacterium sp. LS1R47]|uniref:Signal peptidase n=1 Tax=Flavobacterium frigoritolerans TaxID=2987686 RepID=A0A9X3C6H1_9FLAO|nr:hypothetical protein [Flavobacterium frigoritolerans]MCV9932099.1 hypothetical protein [Flavobacterium frigoritolerans]